MTISLSHFPVHCSHLMVQHHIAHYIIAHYTIAHSLSSSELSATANDHMSCCSSEREALFRKHPLAAHVGETLLHVFVSIEMTGQGVEFEQKFNYRRPMYAVLQYVWSMKLHRDALKASVCQYLLGLSAMQHYLCLSCLVGREGGDAACSVLSVAFHLSRSSVRICRSLLLVLAVIASLEILSLHSNSLLFLHLPWSLL